MDYEILDHTADIRVRVKGHDFHGLLRNTALSMMDMIVGSDSVQSLQEVPISIEAETGQELLVKLLNEVLYLGEVNKMVFHDIVIRVSGNCKVSGKLFGEAYDSTRHDFKNDIKAVTYHELKIEKTGDTLMAEITFDI